MSLGFVVVRAEWDDEAGVWVAQSDDVPGLICEAENLDKLQGVLAELIPELLVENGVLTPDGPTELPMYVMAQKYSKISLQAA